MPSARRTSEPQRVAGDAPGRERAGSGSALAVPAIPSVLVVLVTAVALVVLHPTAALAAAAAKATGDDAPLDLGGDGGAGGQPVGPGGGSIARVIVGLLIVVAVIYGVTWILKQLKGGKQQPVTAGGLEQVTTMPLQGGGALSLVRVGDELLLLGSGANGATTLRRYDEDEARELGLWPGEDVDADGPPLDGTRGGGVVTILARAVAAARARTVRDGATGTRTEVVLASTAAVPVAPRGLLFRDAATAAPVEVARASSAAAPPAPRGLLFRDDLPTIADPASRAFVAPGADLPPLSVATATAAPAAHTVAPAAPTAAPAASSVAASVAPSRSARSLPAAPAPPSAAALPSPAALPPAVRAASALVDRLRAMTVRG